MASRTLPIRGGPSSKPTVPVGQSNTTPSSSSPQTYIPPGITKFVQNSHIERAYIILPGIYTGDIWHCAAAQILWEFRREDASIPHPCPDFMPVTACISFGPRSGTNDESPCTIQGKPSYEYLTNIGLHAVVVETQTPTAQSYGDIIYRAMDWQTIENLYQTQMPLDQGYDAHRASQTTPLALGARPRDPRIVRYDVSTTIMMQLVQYLGVAESVQILAHRLWCGDGYGATDSAEVQTKASAKLNQLKALVAKAQAQVPQQNASNALAPVLLFNYRHSDKNTTLDSSDALLQQVQNMARSKGMGVVIIAAGFGAQKIKEFEGKIYLDIYSAATQRSNFIQDKRVTACFWSLVARELQSSPRGAAAKTSSIVGLIGGRSGSVDIASFVGVKAVSWDDPIFEPGVFTPDKIGQMPQVARLLNQRPVSFMAFLAPAAPATASQTGTGSTKRKVAPTQLLRGNFLDVFLQPQAWPENQPSPFSTFRFTADDHKRMENAESAISVPELGIRPVYLAAYIDEHQ